VSECGVVWRFDRSFTVGSHRWTPTPAINDHSSLLWSRTERESMADLITIAGGLLATMLVVGAIVYFALGGVEFEWNADNEGS
jgi:hypothetical protein